MLLILEVEQINLYLNSSISGLANKKEFFLILKRQIFKDFLFENFIDSFKHI